MRRWTRPRRRALLLEAAQWSGVLLIVVGIVSVIAAILGKGDAHPELATGGVGLVLLKAVGGD